MATEHERELDKELSELLDRIEVLLGEVRLRVGGVVLKPEPRERDGGDGD